MRVTTPRHIYMLTLPAMVVLLLCVLACSGGKESANKCTEGTENHSETSAHPLPDTLRVGTLYSPTSYFIYREEPMGYEYEMMMKMAKDKGMEVKLEVAGNINRLIEMLDSGLIDVAAYEIPVTAEYKERVLHCGIPNITNQVLVQPKVDGKPAITDVTQLVGKTIYVEEGSKYEQRARNLNQEIGGGINIQTIQEDTLIAEDLIERVNDGRISLTIVDSDIARLNSTYFRDLDVSMAVSLDQKASWAVNPNDQWLADSINAWAKGQNANDDIKMLQRRYFELAKYSDDSQSGNIMLGGGKISNYDDLFRKYAKDINWDWRYLAAIGYTESGFRNDQTSWAGAKGIMQIMPRTAGDFGLSLDEITNPDRNIATAAKILASLEKTFTPLVKDPAERRKFILAAYNSGPAHILDAIALAKKYGKNPEVWFGNVRECLIMKSRPEYYNDPVVKYGYFRPTQTIEYVDKVTKAYNTYCEKIKS